MKSPTFDLASLTAIDAHVHAERHDDHGDVSAAAARYFGSEDAPLDLDGLAAYYRERRMAAVLFTVDERLSGRSMVPNDDVLAAAARHPDVLIPFASVDPTRGAAALAEVDRLVATGAVRGFKLHPPLMRFSPDDRAVYPFYERVQAARLPLVFHTGHSGIGTGVRGGGGIRLKYGNPMPIDDVAVDFPDLPIVLAHPSFPWQDEAISICLHKPNVFIDLSGWSPKVFLAGARAVREHAAAREGAVRFRLPADHARPLAARLRRAAYPRRGAAIDFEGERRAAPRAGLSAAASGDAMRHSISRRRFSSASESRSMDRAFAASFRRRAR